MDPVIPEQQSQRKKPSALKLFINSRGNSFKYASRGLSYVMRTQKMLGSIRLSCLRLLR